MSFNTRDESLWFNENLPFGIHFQNSGDKKLPAKFPRMWFPFSLRARHFFTKEERGFLSKQKKSLIMKDIENPAVVAAVP